MFQNHFYVHLSQHAINNPAKFWGSAQKNLSNLPKGGVKRVINVFPNQNMDVSTCVWEADSIKVLDSYLRDKVGDASEDTCYEIMKQMQ